jgi:hypothetical protein
MSSVHISTKNVANQKVWQHLAASGKKKIVGKIHKKPDV